MNFNDYCVYENGLLRKKNSKLIYGSLTTDGYIRVNIQGKRYKAHRIIWEMFNGKIPESMVIDHIDGNKANNMIENLRLATQSQNQANKVGTGSWPKGVKVCANGKFQARVRQHGKTYHLGTFSTVEEASAAYATKAIELYGEFAQLK